MKKLETKLANNSWYFILISLLILGFIFSVIMPKSAHSTEFSVSGVNDLISAINSANDEFEYPGPDTISLTPEVYLLTEADNENDGPNGLPSITSTITINGSRV